jgi:hypothetical protein
MNKKIFLTETDKKKIISEKERMIIETFAKNFNKIKRIDENEIEANNLNSGDQEILDDILSINENVDFNTVIDKIKNYAKKGLLNTAIVMSLLGNPSFTQAQKDQIQNITNIEQTIDDKEKENEAKGEGISPDMLLAKKIALVNAKANLEKKLNINVLSSINIIDEQVYKLENGTFKYIVTITLDK